MGKNESIYTQFLIRAYTNFLEFYGLDPSSLHFDSVVALDISTRYFRDLDRLTRYHSIKQVDAPKIAGFSTYWISKLKPISIISPDLYKDASEFCIYVNEVFALYIATGRLMCSDDIEAIRLNEKFLTMFLYTLKYRQTSGDTLSLMYYLTENATL